MCFRIELFSPKNLQNHNKCLYFVKKINMKKIIFAVFVCCITFQSCTFETGVPAVVVVSDSIISYSKIIFPLDSVQCNGCHSGSAPGDFTTYAGIKEKADNGTLLDRVVTLKNMPTPGSGFTLTDEERNKYLAWIQQGALDN